jgi:hypothetical protein
MEPAKVNVSRVLELLRNEKYEIEWDDCWETLKLLDSNYRSCSPLLLEALRFETSFARLYAMEALTKIGLSSAEITEAFLPLLKDKDYEVQLEVLKWIGSHNHKSSKTRVTLRSLLMSSNCALYLKIKVLLMLLLGRHK